jgi:hypothetical protein
MRTIIGNQMCVRFIIVLVAFTAASVATLAKPLVPLDYSSGHDAKSSCDSVWLEYQPWRRVSCAKPKVRAMPYVYQEYPKWIAGPDVIVRNASEERCIRWQWSRMPCSAAASTRSPWNSRPRFWRSGRAAADYREIAQALPTLAQPDV